MATVASEVRDMREAARGLLLDGWFYYAISAIGEHQLRRVPDAAVLHRYQQAGEALRVLELLGGRDRRSVRVRAPRLDTNAAL